MRWVRYLETILIFVEIKQKNIYFLVFLPIEKYNFLCYNIIRGKPQIINKEK